MTLDVGIPLPRTSKEIVLSYSRSSGMGVDIR